MFLSPILLFFFLNAASARVTYIDLCATLGSANPSAPSLLDSALSSPGISERSLVPTQLIQLIKSLTSNRSGGSCLVLFLPPYLFTSLALIPSELNHLSLHIQSKPHFRCRIRSKPLILPPILVQSFLHLFCFLCIFPRTFSYCPILSPSSAKDRCCLLRFSISQGLSLTAQQWLCTWSSCLSELA